ncbi:MAG: hypothetical protein ACF8K1_05330 [Phycisphaerales bacterium JB047]
MAEENPTPQGDQTSSEATPPQTTDSQADSGGGVLSGGNSESESNLPWKDQFPNDKDGTQVWQAYNELRKKLSAGEHKAKPQTESKAEPSEDNGWSEEKEQRLQRYEVEQRRQAINKELGLDFDTEQWRDVADYATKNRTPDQLKNIEDAIERGLYSEVEKLVKEFNSQQTPTDEPSAGDTPRSASSGGGDGFASADEAKKFLRESRGLTRSGSGQEWIERLNATPDRIRKQLGMAEVDRPRFS